MDILTKTQRSELMSKVKSKNTNIEIIVRKIIYGLGFRYRLHVKTLPGNPDIVFKGRKKIINVNGCFWHGHKCKLGSRPSSNTEFWNTKINSNILRDKKNKKALIKLGWKVKVIWGCETKNLSKLEADIKKFLT